MRRRPSPSPVRGPRRRSPRAVAATTVLTSELEQARARAAALEQRVAELEATSSPAARASTLPSFGHGAADANTIEDLTAGPVTALPDVSAGTAALNDLPPARGLYDPVSSFRDVDAATLVAATERWLGTNDGF